MAAKQKSQSASEYCLGWTWLLSSSERRLRSFGGGGRGGRSLGKELLATPGGSLLARFYLLLKSQLLTAQCSAVLLASGNSSQKLETGLGGPRIAEEQIKETQETELLGNAPHSPEMHFLDWKVRVQGP